MATFRINGKRTQSPRIKALIEAAPGYTGAGTYDILETEGGGYRVYRIVGDKAMDASLKDLDIERLIAAKSHRAIDLGLKEDSI